MSGWLRVAGRNELSERYTKAILKREMNSDPDAMPKPQRSRYLRASGRKETLAPAIIPDDLEARLQAAADAAGVSLEEMLRHVVEQGVRILEDKHGAAADGTDR